MELNIAVHNANRDAEMFDTICRLLSERATDAPRWLEKLVEDMEAAERGSK